MNIDLLEFSTFNKNKKYITNIGPFSIFAVFILNVLNSIIIKI